MIKTKEEIKNIKKAVSITDEIYLKIKPKLKAGRTEGEVLKELLSLIKNSEADGPSFDPIIASGPGGAEPTTSPQITF